MPKDSSTNVRHDPLALRLAALAGLIDDVIGALARRADRFRDVGVAIALARETHRSTERRLRQTRPREELHE
jgi:hypothetical protein